MDGLISWFRKDKYFCTFSFSISHKDIFKRILEDEKNRFYAKHCASKHDI